MSVSLDKIDVIMERANVSYQEAKEALENHKGDIVEALVELEQSEKIKKNKKKIKENINEKGSSLFGNLKDQIKKMHKYKFKITKEKETVLSIPSTIAALLIIICFPVSIVILGILLLVGYRISIKTNESEIVVNDLIKKEKENE